MHIKKDTRNVIDYYKYWDTESIKANLDTKRNNFSVLCTNIRGDFNIGTIVRNANAFLAKEVIVYGKKRFDKRGTVGTHNYTNFKIYKEIEDLEKLKEYIKDYNVIGVDNIEKSEPIQNFNWDKNKHTLMVFGEESLGIPKEILELCQQTIYIQQLGSVRSINVGTASGIAMFSYCEKNIY